MITAKGSGLREALDAALDDVADAMMVAIRDAANDTKDRWRQDLLAAGLSQRLANTVRTQVYPQTGRALDPAATIYSRAPQIMNSIVESIVIRPLPSRPGRYNGRPMLWIPTQNVPMAGRGKVMTPQQVEASFGQRFKIISARKPGHYLALVYVVAARNRKGWRKATPGRLEKGRDTQMKLMFVLAPYVRTKKRLDMDSLAGHGADLYARYANRVLGSS